MPDAEFNALDAKLDGLFLGLAGFAIAVLGEIADNEPDRRALYERMGKKAHGLLDLLVPQMSEREGEDHAAMASAFADQLLLTLFAPPRDDWRE